jgi:hypothetical protein
MAEWSVNNRACTSMWMALRILAQHKKVFGQAGALTMKDLAFRNTTASDELHEVQARTLAVQLNNVFQKIDGAKLESGVTEGTAVADMEAVLTDDAKTVADLAEVSDRCYRFFGEVS